MATRNSFSDCLRIAGKFTPKEVAELESQVAKLSDSPTNEDYIAAISDLITNTQRNRQVLQAAADQKLTDRDIGEMFVPPAAPARPKARNKDAEELFNRLEQWAREFNQFKTDFASQTDPNLKAKAKRGMAMRAQSLFEVSMDTGPDGEGVAARKYARALFNFHVDQHTKLLVLGDPNNAGYMVDTSSGLIDLAPSGKDLAASKEEFEVAPGYNAKRTTSMLGAALYGDVSNIAAVSVKEMMQNAYDATKASIANGSITEGKIDINVDAATRVISVVDNGTGMSPETVATKFLEIAGSKKETERGSGAFGIAKVLFLYGSERVHVVTIRDGMVTELRTSGGELMDAMGDPTKRPKASRWPVDEAPAEVLARVGHDHGTYVAVTIPESYVQPSTGKTYTIEMMDESYRHMVLQKSPLFEEIEVTFNGKTIYGLGKYFRAHKFTGLAKVTGAWGTANLYVSTKQNESMKYGRNMHVLSNGIWQFDLDLTRGGWGNAFPYEFYLDVRAEVEASEAGYPFSMSRQQFSEATAADFKKLLDYVKLMYMHLDVASGAAEFGKAHYLNAKTKANGDVVSVRPSKKLDLSPTIKTTGAIAALKPGANVTVKDGALVVDGRTVPEIDLADVSGDRPDFDSLKIPQSTIDPTLVMVHSNFAITEPAADGSGRPTYPSYDDKIPVKDIDEAAREKFGARYDKLLHYIGTAFQNLREAFVEDQRDQGHGAEYEALLEEAIGISYDHEYRGVSIRAPFAGMFVNPAGLHHPDNPHLAGLHLFTTMAHELAHYKERQHGANWGHEFHTVLVSLENAYGVEGLAAFKKHLIERLRADEDIVTWLNREGSLEHGRNIGATFKDRSEQGGSDSNDSDRNAPVDVEGGPDRVHGRPDADARSSKQGRGHEGRDRGVQGAGEGKGAQARVVMKPGATSGVAYNEHVTAGLSIVQADDDIALEYPGRVGALKIDTINRQYSSEPGHASEVLKAITDWADSNDMRVVLMPSSSGNMNNDALRSWYRRNGFATAPDGAMVRESGSKVEAATSDADNLGAAFQRKEPERTNRPEVGVSDKRMLDSVLPEPKQHSPMQHGLRTAREMLSGWRANPWILGWLSMRQIGDRFGEDKESNVHKYVHRFLQMGRRAEQIVSAAHDAITPWRNLPELQQSALARVMLAATLSEVHPDKSYDDGANEHLRGTTPSDYEDGKKVYDKVAASYKALTPRAKAVYAAVRDAAAQQWKMLGDAQIKALVDAYTPTLGNYISPEQLGEFVQMNLQERVNMLDLFDRAGTPVAVQHALRRMHDDITDTYRARSQMRGPYFPLVRNGKHVVVAKSQSLSEAAAEYNKARDKLQELYNMDAPDDEAKFEQFEKDIAAARKATNEARARVEGLKDSDYHYSVTFFEHRWEAESYLKQLREDPNVKRNKMSLAVEERADHYRQLDSASPAFVRKLTEELRRSMPRADFNLVDNAVREVYLRAMPDRSALKSELRRLGVPGARATEMMRGFAQRTMGNAFRISRMEYRGELDRMLSEMRTSKNPDELIVANELSKRMANSMMPGEPSLVLDAISQATHLTFLGLSPSYVMVNASQPWVITLPMLAARHGWETSAKFLGDASLEVMKIIKVQRDAEADKIKRDGRNLAALRSWRFNLNPDQLGRTASERRMIRELFDDGLLNITIEHDMRAVSKGDVSNKWLNWASEAAATPAHVIEIVNRVATALTAFRLQYKPAGGEASYEAARDYATQVVAETHFDYSSENAPRLMRADSLGGLGRLVFQFKKYVQGITYLLGRLLRDMANTETDPAKRREAAKGFAYLNGMVLGVAGTSGLPIAGAVGLLFKALSKLWDDDDEPDIGQYLYNGLQDAVGAPLARAIVKGLPAAAGVDLSSRLGMASVTNPVQYVDFETRKGRDLYASLLVSLGGPSSAMMANWFEAASAAGSDPSRAATLVLPKAFSDPLKAYDRANRGIVSRAGNELVPASEFNTFNTVMKALGFESTPVTDMYQQRATVNTAVNRVGDVRGKLMRQYYEASEAGKPTGTIMDKIIEFNRRNPNSSISPKTLRESGKQRQRIREETKDGVRVTPRTADVMDQLRP